MAGDYSKVIREDDRLRVIEEWDDAAKCRTTRVEFKPGYSAEAGEVDRLDTLVARLRAQMVEVAKVPEVKRVVDLDKVEGARANLKRVPGG